MSHRNDTEYWKHCLNKTWDNALINLEHRAFSGFKEAAHNRTYNFKYPSYSGLHCIAAGMHWAPTNKTSLIKHGGYDEEGLEKEFKTYINNLNERRDLCKQLVKEKPSLFSVLKNVHK